MMCFSLLNFIVFYNKWYCCWNMREFNSQAGLAVSAQRSIKMLCSVYVPKRKKNSLYVYKLIQQRESKPN